MGGLGDREMGTVKFKTRLLRLSKEAPLRINPEQAQAFGWGVEGLTF